MNIFKRLYQLDRTKFWWTLTEDGFSIYLNCNDLQKGTADAIVLYDGTTSYVRADYGEIITEGLDFLENFLLKYEKDLEIFYKTYTFEALNVLQIIINEFKRKYEFRF